MRILITGVPGAGKTTLSETLGKVLNFPVLHTDSTKDMDWSDASEEVSRWLDAPGPWILEGVVVPRAFRKWYARGGEGKPLPFDRLVVMRTERKPYTLPGQPIMAKQVMGLLDTYKELFGDKWVEL